MKDLFKFVNPYIKEYVEKNILPRYDNYDAAHTRRHILSVIAHSFEIADSLNERKVDSAADLDPDMIYTIAAYHDIGVCEGRKFHHISSGRMLMEDKTLEQWFMPEQMNIMKEAVEDHRASTGTVPRSIYGKIVSEADKSIDIDEIISRVILYGKDNYPEMTPKEHYNRCVSHLKEKYGDGGYLHLQFENTPNSRRLEEMRQLIRDPEALKAEYNKFCIHPLEPFLPEHAKILFLGSFPPPEARWSMNFYYPNFQNDMWKILGYIFYNDKSYFIVPGEKRFDYDKAVSFSTGIGLAFYDAAYMVKREKGNASDQFLKIMEPTDIKSLLGKIPECTVIVSTGGKSAETIADTLKCAVPSVGGYVEINIDGRHVSFYRMPSSSRAYPVPLEQKAESYTQVFKAAGII